MTSFNGVLVVTSLRPAPARHVTPAAECDRGEAGPVRAAHAPCGPARVAPAAPIARGRARNSQKNNKKPKAVGAGREKRVGAREIRLRDSRGRERLRDPGIPERSQNQHGDCLLSGAGARERAGKPGTRRLPGSFWDKNPNFWLSEPAFSLFLAFPQPGRTAGRIQPFILLFFSSKSPFPPGILGSGSNTFKKSLTPEMPGGSQTIRKGHRGVDSTGETTYKKTTSSALKGAIQLGITHTVGSLSTKPERDVLMQDFYVVESIFFPSEGSNLTPAHHYNDFRFKTYAPVAFRYFRELFGIRPDDYLYSLCSEPLIELSNSGASGSLFYVSSDDEFIIKTVQHKEAEFLQKLLPGYYMVRAPASRPFLGIPALESPPLAASPSQALNAVENTKKIRGKPQQSKQNPQARRIWMFFPCCICNFQSFPICAVLCFFMGFGGNQGCSVLFPVFCGDVCAACSCLPRVPGVLYRTRFCKSQTPLQPRSRPFPAGCRSPAPVSWPGQVLQSFKIMDYSLLVAIHSLDQAQRERAAAGGPGERERDGDGRGRPAAQRALYSTAMESIQGEARRGGTIETDDQ
ncbi:uncharacterized protein LOC120503949 [Passer montanus]|uniref:uncharacterized protein LOC120503949 n=1 Tax=Passer montanus TaxID=9160 RepID=UPI0019602CD5|nr:uncharacterized protein LOC120503949 [Passer montanus]